MKNRILDAVSGFHIINGLLRKYVREGSLCLEEKKTIWETYKNNKDTNSLIEDAEQEAHKNIDELYTDDRKRFSNSRHS
jgi:hypothetical protein